MRRASCDAPQTDRHWEQGEDMSLLEFKVLEYRPSGNMVVVDQSLRDEITKLGIRETMRRTRLSQHTLEAIRGGQPIRRATLQRARVRVGQETG